MMAEDISPEEDRLEAALERQERLGWVISALAVLLTAGFMVAITADWPVLSRPLFGHSVNGFTVTALGLLGLFIVAILIFSTVANRTDRLRGNGGKEGGQ